MKKILSILLAVAMVFSLVIVPRVPTARAATDHINAIASSYQIIDPYPGPTSQLVQNDNYQRYVLTVGGTTSPANANNLPIFVMSPSTFITGTSTTQNGTVILCKPGDYANPISSTNIAQYSFSLPVANVQQDGIYEVYDSTSGSAHTIGFVFIKYNLQLNQTTITYNAVNYITGMVLKGDGTGASNCAVVVLYPDGKNLVYSNVASNGQFSVTVYATQQGAYSIAVVDNYPSVLHNANQVTTPDGNNTVDAFVYKQLTTGTMALKLTPVVSPVYLYNDGGVLQQEVVFTLTDQDGNVVSTQNSGTSNVSFTVSGFANYSVIEIAKGYYKVVGKQATGALVAMFTASANVGNVPLTSNTVSLPFTAISDFNPVVSVDVYSSTDALPCAVGSTIVIKPGVFKVDSKHSIYDVSATVDGPVYAKEDTTPTTITFSNGATPLPSTSNVITTVGDPYFHTWNSPSNQSSGTGIVYDGFYSGKDNYLVAPRYLVTGPGTITVKIDQLTREIVDPASTFDSYNATGYKKSATFTICTIKGTGSVDVTPGSAYVNTATDVVVKISNVGLFARVTLTPEINASGEFTLPNGTVADTIVFDPTSGTANANSFTVFDQASGTVTFKGLIFNKFDYIDVQVDTYQLVNNGGVYTYQYVPFSIVPGAIYVNVPSKTLTATVENFSSDNNYLVAGVPNTIKLSGFVPGASIYSIRMDVAGDGSAYYNVDGSGYALTDLGNGNYSLTLNPPPSVWGIAWPTSVKITLKVPTNDGTGCTIYGSVTVPVKLPTFETTLTVGDGSEIANDNVITEGYIETLKLTKLVDPRTGAALTPTALKVSSYTSSSEAYLPTAWYNYQYSPTSVSIIAFANPNVKNSAPKLRPYIQFTYGSQTVSVRLNSAALTVKPATITLDPTTIPYPGPSTGTLMTITAIDAHGKALYNRTVTLGSFVQGSWYWTISAPNTDMNGKTMFKFVPSAAGVFYAKFANDLKRDSNGNIIGPFGTYQLPSYMVNNVSVVKNMGSLLQFTAKYVQDTTPPTLTVTSPADKSTVNVDTVKVTGKATDDIGVTLVAVNDVPVTLLPDGSFATTVTLAEGENTIVVKAFDAAGNVATQTLTVTYKKPAPPAPTGTKIVLRIGSDVMTVNGKVVQLDAAPEIKDGRTFLPLRAIAEAFGAQVTWVPETQGITVVLGNNQIGLQIGNNTAVVNGNVLSIVPPYIKNGRTMVPLRVIAEGFGAQVEWDPVNYIITITMP